MSKAPLGCGLHAGLVHRKAGDAGPGAVIVSKSNGDAMEAKEKIMNGVLGGRLLFHDWRSFHNTERWMELSVKVFGFPQADAR